MNNLPSNILVLESYIAMVKNSVGIKMFQNFFIREGGKKKDILNGGEFSCAIYVSSILYIWKLINGPHCTVISTLKDLDGSNWYEIKKPKIGAVLIWEATAFSQKDIHTHIGFYIGSDKAISNDYKSKKPKIHHYTFNNKRKISHILWNDKLEKNSK